MAATIELVTVRVSAMTAGIRMADAIIPYVDETICPMTAIIPYVDETICLMNAIISYIDAPIR